MGRIETRSSNMIQEGTGNGKLARTRQSQAVNPQGNREKWVLPAPFSNV
jgi:hypothetical protein